MSGDNALSDTRGNIHSIFQKQAWQLVESEIQLGKKTRQSLSEFMNAYMKKHREVFEKKGEEISKALEEFVNAGTNKKRESLANLIARKYSNLITERRLGW